MAKNIYMVDPFEVLTGNLGSKQDLRYREHDNKAYEAPDGIARAKNYRTRYVGVRRADGSVYFMVKKMSTSNLNNTTRMTMALFGVVAAMKSALRTAHAADWAKLQQAYAYQVDHGISVPDTFDKWVNEIFRTMLMYKQTAYTFNQASISVTVTNPYANNASALVINNKIWVKFLEVLIPFVVASFEIDRAKFYCVPEVTWEELLSSAETENPNMRASYAGISIISAGANPLYNGQPIYSSAGVEQTAETSVLDTEKYTTIAPSA